MKLLAATIATLSLMVASSARAEQAPRRLVDDLSSVAPQLEKYAQGPIADLWKRPALAPRDRSIVTLAALIARNQTIDMPHHIALALDNGVKPREISEIITHLAFYSGWANALGAVAVAKDVFAARKIGADQLPVASPSPLPLDAEAEAQRAQRVEAQFGKSRRASCNTRPTFCSAICGCARTSRRAIAAWSRSARWSRPARSRRSPTTSPGR